ncbi:hypothetical protein HOY82DRAFT_629388 [Tuber indicum]|nr:hypothetical protein HOY82DRAFT_629388 [Tuber indicum]
MTNSMNRVPHICTRIGVFGPGWLGGGSPGVGEALSAIRKVGTTVALFVPGCIYMSFNGTHFETADRRFLIGDGSDTEGSPKEPVSRFVSEKACGGWELFRNFNGGFGKGRLADGVVCCTNRTAFDTHWRNCGAYPAALVERWGI